MPNGRIRQVHVVQEFEAYRDWFSDDWAKSFCDLTEPAATLSAPALGLVVESGAVAYAMSLPVVSIEQVRAYHDGVVNTGEVNSTLLRMMDGFTGKLARRIPGLNGDPEILRQVQREIVNIGATLEEKRAPTLEFPIETMWREYLKLPVYNLVLWGSQQNAFVSICNSYEHFLTELVRIALGLDECRTTPAKEFECRLHDAFGETLKENCWTTDEMQIARAARHALSHAGGGVTRELRKFKSHGFVEHDGRIHVTPAKTKRFWRY